MLSPSTSRHVDLEGQRNVLQPYRFGKALGEGETHETPSEMASDASQPSADLAHIVVLQVIGKEDVTYEMKIRQSERHDPTDQTPAQVKFDGIQSDPGTQAGHAVDNPGGADPDDDPSQEPRMIGDFHGSANALWSLYGKEAKSHDEARIQPLKDDMDGVLIFAGLFSAALTSFVVDSKQNLQVNPTDQMVYYLQQHSTILSQISQQIASIAPQLSIPSPPPQPFPAFKPAASDIRINAFWFMALAFSLSAALLAILVQQWVRNYMHVFQRYSDPQKRARMRQYLYEGSERWYMPIAAEAVPGLLHVSLFLFFAGLADSTLNINTTIVLSTTVPIGICGLLYIFTTFGPVIHPQSPYQTSFSSVIWYAIQRLRGRRFKDRDGDTKSVSTNMAQGQMQLSMEVTKERNGRDKRAVLWLLDNLTEDAEIESFVMSMPGSLEMWTEFSKDDVTPAAAEPSSRLRMFHNALSFIPRRFRTFTASHSSANAMANRRALHSANTHHSITTSTETNTIREFCWRMGLFFDTCKNRATFTSDELWRTRVRACFEVMASLVAYANAEIGWFGDTLQALGDIGSFEGMRSLSLFEKDEAYVVRWTCLSIAAIRSSLKNSLFREHIPALSKLSWPYLYTTRVARAQDIDEALERRWRNEHDWRLSTSFAAHKMRENNGYFADFDSANLNETVNRNQLPGAQFDFPDSEQQCFELFCNPAKLRFISCRTPLNKFLDYLGRIDGYQDNSSNSEEPKQVIEKIFRPKHLLQRRMWNLDDLFSGGLGFAVELFLLSFKQLLSTHPSQESYSALYVGTFRAITSDRREYRHSRGTAKILLDAVASDQGFLRTFNYPDYITDEVWELLSDILEEQTKQTASFMKRHIDSAVQQLTCLQYEDGGKYRDKTLAVIDVISRFRA